LAKRLPAGKLSIDIVESGAKMGEARRADRTISKEEADELLDRAEYGILSTVGADGLPYGIPVSYCVIGDDIYFHCAMEGRKLDNIAHNPQVSFCVVGKTNVLPDKFSTEYESTVVSGTAGEVFDKEKQKGLEGLLHKYSVGHFEKGLKYIEALNYKTRVYRIHIESISGKARR
jgi:uncharacterized protein